jgi:membrane-associated phospholipid phosphatase
MTLIFKTIWVRQMSKLFAQTIRPLARLEVYELASLFMLSVLFVVFISFPARLHRVLGTGGSRHPLLDNALSLVDRPDFWLYGTLSVLIGLIAWFTRRKTDTHAVQLHRFARVALTFIAVLIVFDVINFYTVVFDPYDHDRLLQHLDDVLFRTSPTRWFDAVTCWPLTLLFCGAYSSWFVMTYFSVFLFSRHSHLAMREYVTAAVCAFYIGYITYFFVPAIGPIFTMHFTHSIGPLENLVDGNGPFLSRDCFPSLHTGLSVVMLIHAWRYCRKLFWFYALDVSLIILSTLYLRVHYGVDLIAGAALAIAVCQVAPAFVSGWDHTRSSYENDAIYRHSATSQSTLSELA